VKMARPFKLGTKVQEYVQGKVCLTVKASVQRCVTNYDYLPYVTNEVVTSACHKLRYCAVFYPLQPHEVTLVG
jgi:hypothetical protein